MDFEMFLQLALEYLEINKSIEFHMEVERKEVHGSCAYAFNLVIIPQNNHMEMNGKEVHKSCPSHPILRREIQLTLC